MCSGMLKILRRWGVSFFLCFVFTPKIVGAAFTFQVTTPYQICFTPVRQCANLIIQLIMHAKQTVYVQAYSFTDKRIAKALMSARASGVDVQIILDKSQFKGKYRALVRYFLKHDIRLWKDKQVAIAHNKVMIIDKRYVETGSFNYTYAASFNNAENVLIIDSPQLAQSYLENWEYRKRLSQPISRKYSDIKDNERNPYDRYLKHFMHFLRSIKKATFPITGM